MLAELSVKDIALVKKAAISFEDGLNVLTGETGAGKSVIIDSALMALGGRVKSDVIRDGAESAYIELVFSVDEERKKRLVALDVGFEDDTLVISRRIMPKRSISRINDETVTLSKLRAVAGLLLDVYGQNEYYTLKDPKSHLGILDEYMGEAGAAALKRVRGDYASYKKAKEYADGFSLDENERIRRADILDFELSEIEGAALKPGEEEELSIKYKKLNNAKDILENLSLAHKAVTETDIGTAIDSVGRAARFDDGLLKIREELLDAQSILDSCAGDITAYADELEIDDEALKETEDRLELIRKLELKYGRTIEDVLKYRDKLVKELDELNGYEIKKAGAEENLRAALSELEKDSEKLSGLRRTAAAELGADISGELKDLGFEKPRVYMEFGKRELSPDGFDTVRFMTELNPGEPAKALDEVASGGELSRVMLAVKTCLARTDDMPTLIFDEIDTGISGRTAQKVAEKLDVISRTHQVICVSHLPQIAAMADTHFLISKSEMDGRNITEISKLDDEGEIGELARMLGGARITDTVRENALEMKALAASQKMERRK